MQNNNKNNNKIDYSQDDQMEIVNGAFINVFNNPNGEIVLNYLINLFNNKPHIDFNNPNITYFNLGKIEAIKIINNRLDFLLTNKDKNEK